MASDETKVCLWIKARQASGADPHETAATLLAWIDDDPYAFCYQIEKAVAAAFDKAGHGIREAYPDALRRHRIGRAIRLRLQTMERHITRDLSGAKEHGGLRRARRADRAAEWEETVRGVRAAHYRKTGFMHGFETLAAGAKRGQQPSFLELAKTRWGRRYERDEV